jgi:hypothetical protein
MLININNKLSDVNGRDDDKMKNSHCDLLKVTFGEIFECSGNRAAQGVDADFTSMGQEGG